MARRRLLNARRTGISVALTRLRSPRAAALYLLAFFAMSSVASFAWARGGVDRLYTTLGMVALPLYVTTEQLWSYKTGNSVESTPAVANGGVYVGSNDGCIYALDADTGEQL